MSQVHICDYCHEIDDLQELSAYDAMAGGDRGPAFSSDTLHFHDECLDLLKARPHKRTSQDA